MSEFTKEQKEYLQNKLKSIREQESKYNKAGLSLRQTYTYISIVKNVLSVSLGTVGLVTLISNIASKNVMNSIISTLSLTAGVYNVVVDTMTYETKINNFFKTSLEYHQTGDHIENLLIETEIGRDDVINDVNDQIKDIENDAIQI